jgi:hypothetical protein
MHAVERAKKLEALEFLTIAGCPGGLLVTRSQHEQMLLYIALDDREKLDEAIRRASAAYDVYLRQPELPIPSERTEHEELEREQLIERLEKLLAMLRS